MIPSNIKHVHGFYKNTDDLSHRTFDKYRDVNERQNNEDENINTN